MSSSLIDRARAPGGGAARREEGRHQHRRAAASAPRPRTTPGLCSRAAEPDDAHQLTRRCVSTCVEDILPRLLRRASHAAPRTCCAATGVTPHSYQTRYAAVRRLTHTSPRLASRGRAAPAHSRTCTASTTSFY
ncbi:hypothetical protein EVAR_13664_1 [Eumeta japonica]|uniref:Uncharacterized protein n=1 Tax=Eumeta variegata TaxID=151549 RepID=A0A4C1UBK1_EUMVA|nr:hypothetical protein EVAR_13664_1 [Eumeta japonica]